MNEQDLKTINDYYEDGPMNELIEQAKVTVQVITKDGTHKANFTQYFDSMKSFQNIIAVSLSMPKTPDATIDITIDSFEAMLSILAYDMHLHEYLEYFDAAEPDQAEEEMEYAMEEIDRFIREFNAILTCATQDFMISSVNLTRRIENPPAAFKCAMDKFEQMMCQHLNLVN